MEPKPTRNNAIQIAQDLINGRKTPAEVSEWAALLYSNSDQRILEALKIDDPLLEEFIGTLGMADLPAGAAGAKLYGIDDYICWLNDFLVAVEA